MRTRPPHNTESLRISNKATTESWRDRGGSQIVVVKRSSLWGMGTEKRRMPPIAPWLLEFQRRADHKDGLLLRGDRIVIPPTLRPEVLVLNTIHEGHIGQEKCLLRARTSVFWPGITKEIINQVNLCGPRRKYQKKKIAERATTTTRIATPTMGKTSDFEFKGPQ